MKGNIKEVCESVKLMEKYLHDKRSREELSDFHMWEHTYIKMQIDKRENGGTFTIQDHIRGMVYSMLSSGVAWNLLKDDFDSDTRQFKNVDKIFFGYYPSALLDADNEELIKAFQNYQWRFAKKQLPALKDNIKMLQHFEDQLDGIDNFYNKIIKIDPTLKTLVLILSTNGSPFKLKEMGEALTAEYLRNVGYNIAKPDEHIRRILGSNILDCSDKEKEYVPIYEAFDIVAEIAEKMDKPTAEVDYILWSYCAKGYGEVCVKPSKPDKCEKCVVKSYCKNKNLGGKK